MVHCQEVLPQMRENSSMAMEKLLPLQPPHKALFVWLHGPLVSNQMAMCEVPWRDPGSCQACQLCWNVFNSWGL